MRYTIIADDNPAELITKINQAINDGWRPQGGIAVAVRSDGRVGYFQAMVHD